MTLFRLYKDSLSGLPKSIWILSLIMLINRAGAMVLPFMSLYLHKSEGYSLPEIGMMMTSLGLGSMAGNYIGGKLVDRFGQYYIQIISLFTTGLLFIGFPMLEGMVQLVIGMFTLNLVADTLRPANISAIAIYGSPEIQTRAVSLNRLAINLGFSIGPAMAGIIAGEYGYQFLFYIDGVTCLLASFCVIALLPRKEERKSKSSERKAANKELLYKDKKYHQFLFLVLIVCFCFVQFFHTIPLFWETQLGLTEAEIGKLLALNGFIIFLTEMPVIHYLVNSGKHKLLVIRVGVLLMAIGFLSFVLPISLFAMLILFTVLLTSGEILALPFQTSYALSKANPMIRGNYMGWYGLMWSLAQVIGPPFGFLMANHFGFSALWILIFVMLLLASLGFGFLHKNEN